MHGIIQNNINPNNTFINNNNTADNDLNKENETNANDISATIQPHLIIPKKRRGLKARLDNPFINNMSRDDFDNKGKDLLNHPTILATDVNKPNELAYPTRIFSSSISQTPNTNIFKTPEILPKNNNYNNDIIGNKRVFSLPSQSLITEQIIDSQKPSKCDTVKDNNFPAEEVTAYAISSSYDDTTDSSTTIIYRFKKIALLGKGNYSQVYLYENITADFDKKEDSRDTTKIPRFVACKHIEYPKELVKRFSNDSNIDDTPTPSTPNYHRKITTTSAFTSADTDMLLRVESSLCRELQVLKGLNHPCVLKLYAVNNLAFITSTHPLLSHCNNIPDNFVDNGSKRLPECYMFTSYCKYGDLLRLAKLAELSSLSIQRIFAEIVIAVKYLHENLIIHRDLKLENIFINYNYYELENGGGNAPDFSHPVIKIGDFGLCKKLSDPNELCTTRCGSEDYVAPEILMGLAYDGRLTDCWALGVILYGLLEDILPFDVNALTPNAIGSPTMRRRISGGANTRKRSTAHKIARYDWKWIKVGDEDDLLTQKSKIIVENCLIRRNQRWDIDKIYHTEYVSSIACKLTFV
ncbi:uncharacterized protein SCODWIG_00250 [Saccharomycodes ludwigii]|uniref:non-specific serine/threonine protein kinase n=1 Tax=Saccharomycodes ludwigii TaxID=36035 RepID=A0A376B1J4_9ASCO|nr:hypothetical protein SCDLUD_003931 [Saccharomycodes ludwigii]KAH3899650.1 hypothetical protein SCDLUD_003931 [Saccharomycodes ludwigii]SSD58489.1 uncharacterized protein SCODWIG_00250 [Saccharomycodes ludwigii]